MVVYKMIINYWGVCIFQKSTPNIKDNKNIMMLLRIR